MKFRPAFLIRFALAAALVSRTLPAASTNYNSDPSHWTGKDVYQILNKSPWTALVKVNLSGSDMGFADSGPGASADSSNVPPPPAGTSGVGRRGGRSATYSSSGSSRTPSQGKPGATEIRVQWQSATIVQMAIAKKDEPSAETTSVKPLEEYVIAIIGLPITALGGRSASADSDATINSEQEHRIEQHVLHSASILRPNHEALTPTKVELDQGSDGRMLIHFPKRDPISAADKSAEFRLALGHAEIRKKFALKDMEFQGKLEL